MNFKLSFNVIVAQKELFNIKQFGLIIKENIIKLFTDCLFRGHPVIFGLSHVRKNFVLFYSGLNVKTLKIYINV